jgi:hypothetical protein
LERETATYENNTIANTTKYATLVSNGLAVFNECIIVYITQKSGTKVSKTPTQNQKNEQRSHLQ